MKSDRKALAALVGAIAAALGVGYATGTLDPFIGRGGDMPATAQAPQPEGEAKPVETAKVETPAEQPAAPAAQPAVAAIVPAFDLLRVEPSGNMVIAGTAQPGSSLEIVSGSEVLAKVQAGTTGDFAAVLEKPLKPGDYQIVLRATGTDGTVVSSTGTAIVSVPETDKGEVLALVEEPGKASRLISATGGTGADAAKTEPSAAAATAQELTAAPGEKPAEASAQQPAAEEKPQDTAAAATAPAETPAPDTAKPAEQTAAAEPAAGAQPSAQPAPVEQPAAATAEPAPATATAPEVAIEAVEIEGDKVFVAGAAKPGETVRVYANDILLGDSRVSAQGRFLVEANRDLPQGDYIIRADVLGANGAAVTSRAAVPFKREAGENIAAVAPDSQAAPAPKPAQPATSAAAEPEQPADNAAAAETTAAPSEAPAATAGTQAATEEPAPAETAAAAEAAPATGPTATAGSAQDAGQEQQAAAAEPVAQAEALQAIDHSVIIRRGDTLWQISRRVYGRGTRYTTIYKANQAQIANPDMIFPGQTFMVPDKSEEGETADMEKLRPKG